MFKPIKIDIAELGPIRNSSIEIEQLTVFTGESGLGKSYAAFLPYYLFEIFTSVRLTDYFKQRAIDVVEHWNNSKNNEPIITFQVSDIIDWLNHDAIDYIGWLVGNSALKGSVKFHLPIEDKEITFTHHEEIKGLQDKEELYYRIACKDLGFNITASHFRANEFYFASLLGAVLCNLCVKDSTTSTLYENILLPPSRGSLMDCVSRPAFKAGMYDEFYDFKEQLLSSRYKGFKVSDEIREIASKCILGNLSSDNNEITYHTEGFDIPLSAAASSVKELSPYLLWLTYTPVIHSSVLFEEPEAHLHPHRQQAVVDTFAYVMAMRCYLIITTHSDYLLKRINQLGRLERMYHSLKTENKRKAEEIMEMAGLTWRSLIDFEKVRAYVLKLNGDGTSRIERIDTKDGISFDSFEQVIEQEFAIDEALEGM